MSIKLLARELYRLEREVTELEKNLASAAPAQQDELKWKLRQVRQERDNMRAILESKKERPVYPRRY